MTQAAEFAPQLRTRGFRVTSQRLAILRVLWQAPGHLLPTQVYSRARRIAPGLTRTTVYRTLDVLGRAGLLWRASQPNGHLAYEIARGDHHHLVCRGCGAEAPLAQAEIDDAFRHLETVSGYSIDHDHLSLSGLCPRCRGTITAR